MPRLLAFFASREGLSPLSLLSSYTVMFFDFLRLVLLDIGYCSPNFHMNKYLLIS